MQSTPNKPRTKTIRFKDFPEFTPNLTPKEIFRLGSFGGTYWRPIHSNVTHKDYKNQHKKYTCLRGIPNERLVRPWDEYDKELNLYRVKVGTTLAFWEHKHWISPPFTHTDGFNGTVPFTTDIAAPTTNVKSNDGHKPLDPTAASDAHSSTKSNANTHTTTTPPSAHAYDKHYNTGDTHSHHTTHIEHHA